jgi:hypothetical protein
MKKPSLTSQLFIVLITILRSGPVAAEDPQNVLVIHSYDAGYEWTRDFHRGIEMAIDSSGSDVKLSVEYLDTKRIISDSYFADLNRYFVAKYANYQFDGVLLTDDNALRFFNQLDLPNLKQLPTVAGGIGDLTASLLPSTDYGTILYEKDYIEENLALIHKLRPNMQRLYYLVDYSYTSMLVREWLLIELRKYPDTELVEIRDIPLERARQKLAQISSDDAVLLTHFNTELDNAVYHGYSYIAETLSVASEAPVFVLWGFYLKGDVLGGYVNRSQDIGIKLVQILGSQMGNQLTVNAVAQGHTPATFQYHVLKKFGIAESELPENSQILDKPESFFDKHRQVVVIFLVISLFLVLVIIVLGALLQRKRELHKRDKKIVALQKQTLDVQKNLIHVLGESIETRSGETGNHVNRVAKLSSHLAKLYGLPPRDCEVIEIISPMPCAASAATKRPGVLNRLLIISVKTAVLSLTRHWCSCS